MTNESRPRMMPVHSPILQVKQNLRDAEAKVEELTKERDEALKQLEAIENELQTVDEIAETPTHFVLLGTPGAHDCDQMGCGYSHVLFRVEKKALPGWVALLAWSQTAYKRLGGLMTIGVSMTPDAVTAKLLSDAPANVSAEVDPFSAEVDSAYSIYTDPLIVGVAEGLDCTVDELMEYAADSVGAPGGETK